MIFLFQFLLIKKQNIVYTIYLFQYNCLLMEDHNLLAIFNLGSDSDSSYGDTSTLPITQSEEVIADQDIYDFARWPDRVRRIGERFSARRGGGPGWGSLWREPETSGPQTSQQSVVSEVQGAQALPTPPVTETLEEPKPQ